MSAGDRCQVLHYDIEKSGVRSRITTSSRCRCRNARPDTLPHANVVAAAAIAAGADAAAIAAGSAGAGDLPWRAQRQGALAGVPVVDDGMAATPRKTTAAIAGYPPRSIVLIAGGMMDAGGGTVHQNPEEQAVLAEAWGSTPGSGVRSRNHALTRERCQVSQSRTYSRLTVAG